MWVRALVCVLLSLPACEGRRAREPRGAAPARPQAFLKGQLHAHTGNSGDSATPPAEAVRWYADHGYDFVVLTDHNVVTSVPGDGDLLAIPGVEITQNLATCDPPPEPGMSCLLHLNALFVSPAGAGMIQPPRPRSLSRVDVYQAGIDAAHDLGGIVQLNHPNFHYAAGASLITELARRGVTLLEVANEAVDSNNGGDADHPSTEALWDAALTAGATIFGVATDDAHHYGDAEAVRAASRVAHTGDRGFVMVRAARDVAAIRAAIAAGDFYSSSGVLLARVEHTGDALDVAVSDASPGAHQIAFIGSGGRVLQRSDGRAARFPFAAAPAGYVRAVIADDHGRRAWTQPVFTR